MSYPPLLVDEKCAENFVSIVNDCKVSVMLAANASGLLPGWTSVIRPPSYRTRLIKLNAINH
jgi:hypothetical protein